MLPFTDQSKVLPKRPTICCVASVYKRSVSSSTPSMSKTPASAGLMSAAPIRLRLSPRPTTQLLRRDVPVQEPRRPIRDVVRLEDLLVEPLDEGGIAERLGILAEVVWHHRQHVEALVELEAQG